MLISYGKARQINNLLTKQKTFIHVIRNLLKKRCFNFAWSNILTD